MSSMRTFIDATIAASAALFLALAVVIAGEPGQINLPHPYDPGPYGTFVNSVRLDPSEVIDLRESPEPTDEIGTAITGTPEPSDNIR